jgi:predicted nucleotidyltransferase
MEIDSERLTALAILGEVLKERQAEYGLIGALAWQLGLGVEYRTTLDVDIVVQVSSWENYDEIKRALVGHGFEMGREPHWLVLGGTHVDLLPYSPKLLRGTKLVWPDGRTMDMTGYEHVFTRLESKELAPELRWPVPPLPVLVILKLVSFRDRGASKDLADVVLCLEHYEEDPDSSRRYSVPEDDPTLVWEYAGAYLLGTEVGKLASADVRELVRVLQELIPDEDAPEVDRVLRELGRDATESRERKKVVEVGAHPHQAAKALGVLDYVRVRHSSHSATQLARTLGISPPMGSAAVRPIENDPRCESDIDRAGNAHNEPKTYTTSPTRLSPKRTLRPLPGYPSVQGCGVSGSRRTDAGARSPRRVSFCLIMNGTYTMR